MKNQNKNGNQTVINLSLIRIDSLNISVLTISFAVTLSVAGVVLFG